MTSPTRSGWDATAADEGGDLLDSTVIEHPSGGSEVIVYGGDGDGLAMTSYIAVDAEDVVDLAEMR